MIEMPWRRADFFARVDPFLATCCGWLVVAVAASVPLGSAASNILGGALLLTMIAAGGYRAHWRRIRAHPLALVTLLLCALILIGISYSSAPGDDVVRALKKYARLLYVPIAVAFLVDGRWRRRALWAWMLAMALTLVLSYVHALWAFPGARATRELAQDDHFIFKHHITQNVMMSVFAVAAFAEAWRLRARLNGLSSQVWLRVGVAFAAAINVLFFVQGRAGYLTLFVNLVVIAMVAVLSSRDRRLLVVAVAMLAIGVTAGVSSDQVRHRLHTAFSEAESSQERGIETSIGQRMEYASKSIDLVQAKPVVGWGTGSYASEYCRIARSPEWCKLGAYNPHNQFLFFAVQFGLLGLAVFIAWLVAAGVAMRRLPVAEQLLGYSLLATLIVHAFLDSPLYIVTEGIWYPLMLGVLTAGAYTPDASRDVAAANTASTSGHSG